MPFQKGNKHSTGRKEGAVNKSTKSAKEAVELAFQGIGGVKAFTEWAMENQTEFYRHYAKLIPLDVTTGGNPIQLVINAPNGGPIT